MLQEQQRYRSTCRRMEQVWQQRETHQQRVISSVKEAAQKNKEQQQQRKSLSRIESMPAIRARLRSGEDLWNTIRGPALLIGAITSKYKSVELAAEDQVVALAEAGSKHANLSRASSMMRSATDATSALGSSPNLLRLNTNDAKPTTTNRTRSYSLADVASAQSRMRHATEWVSNASINMFENLPPPPPQMSSADLVEQNDQRDAAKVVMMLMQRSILQLAPEKSIQD